MTLYLAPLIGSGTIEDPWHPDIAKEINWAAAADFEDGYMVIESPDVLDFPIVEHKDKHFATGTELDFKADMIADARAELKSKGANPNSLYPKKHQLGGAI